MHWWEKSHKCTNSPTLIVSSRTFRLASVFPLKSPLMSCLAHQVTLDILNREAPPTFRVKRKEEMMWDDVIFNGAWSEAWLLGMETHRSVYWTGSSSVFTPALPSVLASRALGLPTKGLFRENLGERHSLLSFERKGRHYLFYSGSPLFDRQVKVFSFGKCLSRRFQEINLATPFLTILWRNLANLAQAITAVPLVINSEAQLVCGPKSLSCSKRCS